MYSSALEIILKAIDLPDGIEARPDMRGGVPVVKGTRIPISRVIADLADSGIAGTISDEYSISRERVEEALAAVADLLNQPWPTVVKRAVPLVAVPDNQEPHIPSWDTSVLGYDARGIASGFWSVFPDGMRLDILDKVGVPGYGRIEDQWGRELRSAVGYGAAITRQRWLDPLHRTKVENEGTKDQRVVTWWECRFCKKTADDPEMIDHYLWCHLMVGKEGP